MIPVWNQRGYCVISRWRCPSFTVYVNTRHQRHAFTLKFNSCGNVLGVQTELFMSFNSSTEFKKSTCWFVLLTHCSHVAAELSVVAGLSGDEPAFKSKTRCACVTGQRFTCEPRRKRNFKKLLRKLWPWVTGKVIKHKSDNSFSFLIVLSNFFK